MIFAEDSMAKFRVYKITLGGQGFKDDETLLDEFESYKKAFEFMDALEKPYWAYYEMRIFPMDEYMICRKWTIN